MKTFSSGAVVQSAEGALYRVGYIDEVSKAATLSLLNDDGGYAPHAQLVTLPVAELRRVVDPCKRKPPILGMPALRPLCQYCQCKLRPDLKVEHAGGSYSKAVIRRTFLRWNCYRGLFCTKGCAIEFAAAAHKAGYRIVKRKPA